MHSENENERNELEKSEETPGGSLAITTSMTTDRGENLNFTLCG